MKLKKIRNSRMKKNPTQASSGHLQNVLEPQLGHQHHNRILSNHVRTQASYRKLSFECVASSILSLVASQEKDKNSS